jgi:excisionase family DNA binding protein
VIDPAEREKTQVLAEELRRRGHDEVEIAALLRKKHRRRQIEQDLVEARAQNLSAEQDAKRKAARRRARPGAASGPICTVEEVARDLRLHPKTVQRFIREGRLPARRVGKSYRILRADLAAFTGLGLPAPVAPPPMVVTAIIDIPAVDDEGLRDWRQRFATRISGKAVSERGAHTELIHDGAQAMLKIVLVGTPAQVAGLLNLIQRWREDGPLPDA